MDKKLKSWWSDICKTKLNTLSRKSAEVRHSERSEESCTRKGSLLSRVPSFVIAHNVRKQTEVGLRPQDDKIRKSAVLDFLHARTTFVFEPSAQSDSMSSHTELSPVRKSAFTLAETMIVIIVLGIIATITVPALLNKSTESKNKTKLKKAMAVYDKAIESIRIEHDFKSLEDLTGWADSDCTNTSQYFKVVETYGSKCQFKTADGLYWDITNIDEPIVVMNKDDIDGKSHDQISTLAKEDNKTAFRMLTMYDDTNSKAFRINDYEYAKANGKGNVLCKAQNFALDNSIVCDYAGNIVEDDGAGCVATYYSDGEGSQTFVSGCKKADNAFWSSDCEYNGDYYTCNYQCEASSNTCTHTYDDGYGFILTTTCDMNFENCTTVTTYKYNGIEDTYTYVCPSTTTFSYDCTVSQAHKADDQKFGELNFTCTSYEWDPSYVSCQSQTVNYNGRNYTCSYSPYAQGEYYCYPDSEYDYEYGYQAYEEDGTIYMYDYNTGTVDYISAKMYCYGSNCYSQEPAYGTAGAAYQNCYYSYYVYATHSQDNVDGYSCSNIMNTGNTDDGIWVRSWESSSGDYSTYTGTKLYQADGTEATGWDNASGNIYYNCSSMSSCESIQSAWSAPVTADNDTTVYVDYDEYSGSIYVRDADYNDVSSNYSCSISGIQFSCSAN